EDLIKDGKTDAFINNKINSTRSQFLEAPFLVILCLDEHDLEIYPDNERNQNEFILGVQSISASATYLLLAFENKGIAASWYCAPLFAKETVKKALNLPNSLNPMAFFTVGYPLKTIKAPKRKKLNDIIYNLNEK
ncbi:MAG: nitroreductase family protein, partial [Promethearchaeota archaeon]